MDRLISEFLLHSPPSRTNLLAAFISSGQLTSDNENELIDHSLKLAIKLALKAVREAEYQLLLEQFGMTVSMSRKGNCSDNAPMESFWGTLKNELIYQRRFSTRQEAMLEIREYIEIFYNLQRKQARLDYLSPEAFERQFYQMKEAA